MHYGVHEMAKQDDTLQNSKVYFPHGADRLGVDSDGLFDFYGTTINGTNLRTYLYTNNQIQTIAASAGLLSVVNLPSGGAVFLSASVGCSNMSAWLTSCPVGAQLVIAWRQGGMGGESVGSVYVSLSGVSLVGLTNQDLSAISIQNSAGSAGVLYLRAIADNVWAVQSMGGTETGLQIAEHASA